MESVDAFIAQCNKEYQRVHIEYERNFWSTKMNLAGASTKALTESKTALDAFLGDEGTLQKTREFLALGADALGPDRLKLLNIFEKTFKCYIVESVEARDLRTQIDQLEADLAQARNKMPMGYEIGGEFTAASAVQLRTKMRTADDEKVRLACLNGLRKIGPFVSERFCEIVRLRNKLAHMQGFEDYYDMKCSQAEGFNKKTLFGILEPLEQQTRPIMARAREALAAAKGASALEPQNMGYAMAGDVTKLKDPYFPFVNAVDMWARSYAALGISYRGSTMRLDLCDRPGKYSNGFCHWEVPAWQSPEGWVPSQTNFTSLADPKAIGSGLTALTTLMHEAGHAAHFANVVQQSPLFSQERAPTSVAYAENQSMFLDSLVDDAAWAARYALSTAGEPIPWSILEAGMRATHEYKVFALRMMLAVPFFEKALYELPADQLTPQRILSLADEVEQYIQGGFSSRPLMTVPHILSGESSAYYHGYVLAEMSVHQTREHFLRKYGSIVDNPRVGEDLKNVYWAPGNSEAFRDLVQRLTGHPLSADAWVADLQTDLEMAIVDERAAYEEARATGPKFPSGANVDLDMRVLLVHGDEVIADSGEHNLVSACAKYRQWLEAR